MLIIIDADPIVYRAGFAAQYSEYTLWVENADGEVKPVTFTPKPEMTAGAQKKAWIAEHVTESGEWKIIDEEKEVIAGELSHALSNAKTMIKHTIQDIKFHYGYHDASVELLLTGKGNYRLDIAEVKVYKGNRPDDGRPVHYQAIRDYMIDSWAARNIEGREADDECSILQVAETAAGRPSVIATIDKDLDMVPGEHYDYVKKVFYTTSDYEGDYLFYRQVLTGDSVDNIPGAHRIGPKSATDIMDSIDHGEGAFAHEAVWKRIVSVYENTIEKYGEKCCYYDKAMEQGAEAVAVEMARLVKMQEYAGQLWNPPGIEDELMEDKVNLDD